MNTADEFKDSGSLGSNPYKSGLCVNVYIYK